MKKQPTIQSEKKQGLHPRNKHASRYDFKGLIECLPELGQYVSKNKFNDQSIDFANPEAVKTLNRALLKFFYKINTWDVPKDYLCPPIPGRADYIHLVADLLSSKNAGVIPRGQKIRLLDIGVGANCVYPIIAGSEYGWTVVGSDIDAHALKNAQTIIDANHLNPGVSLRLQSDKYSIFKGIISASDFFDVAISNPPFHATAADAMAASNKKNRNLGLEKRGQKTVLNFGGVSNELWCEGGEAAFIGQMIKESTQFKNHCFWFTSLVSKSETLPLIYEELKKVSVVDFKTIDMAQGNKKSRFVAWTFFTPAAQAKWKAGLSIP